MAQTAFPCLECGRPTPSTDRYVMCDECIDDFERALDDLHDVELRSLQRALDDW